MAVEGSGNEAVMSQPMVDARGTREAEVTDLGLVIGELKAKVEAIPSAANAAWAAAGATAGVMALGLGIAAVFLPRELDHIRASTGQEIEDAIAPLSTSIGELQTSVTGLTTAAADTMNRFAALEASIDRQEQALQSFAGLQQATVQSTFQGYLTVERIYVEIQKLPYAAKFADAARRGDQEAMRVELAAFTPEQREEVNGIIQANLIRGYAIAAEELRAYWPARTRQDPSP